MEHEMRKDIDKVKNLLKENSEEKLNISGVMHRFTKEDLDACWDYYKQYLIDILNGDYKVEDAREDLLSLIGSKWDSRNGA